MSQCRIRLENYNGIYHNGDKIIGRIECNFKEETTVKGIKIIMKCREYNEWRETPYESVDGYRLEHRTSEHTTEYTREHRTTYTGSNFVLNVEQYIFGSSKEKNVLSRGRHVFPFSYVIPFDVPSSFNGPHGSISYQLEAVVDRPFFRFNYTDKMTLQVVSLIDFNKIPVELQNPVRISRRRKVCSLFCTGGSITMEVEMPKCVFVPGEVIPLRVYISNQSSKNVKELNVYVEKLVIYRVKYPTWDSKKEKLEILSHRDDGVGARSERTFNINLQIPQNVLVLNFSNCKLFSVSYTMRVTCKTPTCIRNLKVEMWIMLGDVQKGSPQMMKPKESEMIRSWY